MAHYVILDENNVVINAHVGRDENDVVLDMSGNPINWELYYGAKRTSYNTKGGIHYQSDNITPSENQDKAFRKNYAGIGYSYDENRDAFIPPKPFNSWILDEFSCLWNPPTPYPEDNECYIWDENNLNWVLC